MGENAVDENLSWYSHMKLWNKYQISQSGETAESDWRTAVRLSGAYCWLSERLEESSITTARADEIRYE